MLDFNSIMSLCAFGYGKQESTTLYELLPKDAGRTTRVFHPDKINQSDGGGESFSADDIATNAGEVTFLRGRALKNLIIKYPYRAKFVAVKLDFLSPYFYLGMLGLIRRFILGFRYLNGKIEILGFQSIGDCGLHMILKNRNATVTTHFSVNEAIGYGGFLDHLNSVNANYVVLRFFEKLPQQYRDGGDLDILISDQDYEKATDFLRQNPGSKMVDAYSESGPANAARIPYYVPSLARKLLNEKQKVGKYYVQNPSNYFFSLAYHCLYHKGRSSGITSNYANVAPYENPDNDYLVKLEEIAEQANLECPSTLEEIDKLMKESGWRPHLDTLDLLATTNVWLSTHLARQRSNVREQTLIACVLKKGFLDRYDVVEDFEKSLREQGLTVLRKEILENERAELARAHLRGGNWSSVGAEEYFPKVIYIVFDSTNYGYICRANNFFYSPRGKKLALRKLYDVDHQSHIHMTDDTAQTMEYLEVLYPEQIVELEAEIGKFDANKRATLGVRLEYSLVWLRHSLGICSQRIKAKIRSLF